MVKAIGLLILLFAPTQGMSSPLLLFNSVSSEVKVGETVTIQLMALDVGNLYGVELEIAFDSAVLEVVDADAGSSGIQILPGNCPSPDFISSNQVDNSIGTIGYAATSHNPSVPCSGGTVASITFMGLAEGKSNLFFPLSLLTNSDGLPIPHSNQNAEINVISADDDDDLLLLIPAIIAGSTNQE